MYFDHIKEKAGVVLMKVRIMISNMEEATLPQVRHCGISLWVCPMSCIWEVSHYPRRVDAYTVASRCLVFRPHHNTTYVNVVLLPTE